MSKLKYLYQNVIENAHKNHRDENQFNGRCPFHDDRRASFSFNEETGQFTCHAGGCVGHGSYDDFVALVREHLPEAYDTFQPVAEYIYHSQSGHPALKVTRSENDLGVKSFFQSYWDGSAWLPGGYSGQLKLTPYRYQQWPPSGPIFLVEGEKCVEALEEAGLVATTSPMGAKYWNADLNEFFKDREVYILPDNDDAGRAYAERAYQNLIRVAKVVKIVVLNDLKLKEDIADWLEIGGTKEKLMDLCSTAPTEPVWTEFQRGNTKAKSEQEGFYFESLADIFSAPKTHVASLVEGLLPRVGTSVTGGAPKVGKSSLSRQIAAAIAAGEPWLNRKTQQGTVLAICLEEKREQVFDHIDQMGVARDLPIFFHFGSAPQNPVSHLESQILKHRPVLVIIDPAILMIGVKDSNAYGETYQALNPYNELARKYETHIMFIHHANKNSAVSGMDRLMGSTSFFAGVDTSLLLLKDKYGRVTFQMESRSFRPIERTLFQFDQSTRTFSFGESAETDSIDRTFTKIVEKIKESSPINRHDLEAKVGGNSRLFNKALAKLREAITAGELEEILISGEGVKNNPYIFRYRSAKDTDLSSNPYRKEEETECDINSDSDSSYVGLDPECDIPDDVLETRVLIGEEDEFEDYSDFDDYHDDYDGEPNYLGETSGLSPGQVLFNGARR